jgi:hypothetical protein
VSRFRRRGGHVRWELEGYETSLLVRLREGLVDTLHHGGTDDPVVRRLFGPAVSGDEEADAELRSMLRDDLLEGRLAALDRLLEILQRATPRHRGDPEGAVRVDLDEDEPHVVLGALNDLRLALGARVGLETTDRDHVEPGSPEETTLAVMDHLAWMQEQLIAILDPEAVRIHDADEEP